LAGAACALPNKAAHEAARAANCRRKGSLARMDFLE
jgi:hypothetical protein